jgi:hypothetical protein
VSLHRGAKGAGKEHEYPGTFDFRADRIWQVAAALTVALIPDLSLYLLAGLCSVFFGAKNKKRGPMGRVFSAKLPV